jgi:hypothetical protein
MRRWTQGPGFRAAARAQGPGPEPPEPDPAEEKIAAWLTRVRALYGVPVHYLVPDARMLPVESIRFFRVDERWITALVDGAFSLGRPVTGVDPAETSRLARLHARAVRGGPRVRAARFGVALAEGGDAPEGASGFLLRSAVVGGWPNLEVEALDGGGGELLPIRVERLSADLLLGLFHGAVARVKLREPAETLHFGVEPGEGAATKALKYVDTGAGGQQPGEVVEGVRVDVALRNRSANNRVLDVNGLAARLHAALVEHGAISTTPWSPAAFALEMVQGVQEVDFVIEEAP